MADSTQFAARHGDVARCPAHGWGELVAAPRRVQVNGRNVAVVGDFSQSETGPKCAILVGSVSVTVNSKPVARRGDATEHGGSVLWGAEKVIVGGAASP